MSKSASSAEERLKGLISIAETLVASIDPDEVLTTILRSATELFGAEGMSLALLDERTSELVFFAMEGEAKTAPFRIALGRGIAGHVARTGEPTIIADVNKDSRFFAGVDQRSGFKTRSIMCAPLIDRGKTIGVIQALNSTRHGGFRPPDLELLSAFGGLAAAALTRTREQVTVRQVGEVLREETDARYQLVASRNRAMQDALRVLKTAAATTSTVLLLGESGTGKEVAARAIHRWSPRAGKPFVAVNCVALSPTLLESELFGHEKGAFTGAISQRKGKFELADGGTLFLDEIGDLSPDLQTKLLRAIQDREIQRVGGSETIRTDLRLIAATNRDLEAAIEEKRFREDLFYRLNVVTVRLPPLRDRPEDVLDLAEHFLRRAREELKRPSLVLAADARDLLMRHTWPGNARELANAIERAVVLAEGPEIRAADLPLEVHRRTSAGKSSTRRAVARAARVTLAEDVRSFKRQRILEALEDSSGNQAKAARLLGLHPSNLSRMMKQLRVPAASEERQ